MASVGYTCLFTLIHFAELPQQGMFIQLVAEVPVPATEVGTELKQPGELVSRGQGSSSHRAERAATGNCACSSRYFIDTSSWLILYTQKEQIYLLFFKKTKGYDPLT